MVASEPARSGVHTADRGDDPDARHRQSSQGRDVAGHVHAHLDHGGLVFRTEPQERQRQTDLVVLVAFALERPQPGGWTVAAASLVDVLAYEPVTATRAA
jgi:hypothetical protein